MLNMNPIRRPFIHICSSKLYVITLFTAIHFRFGFHYFCLLLLSCLLDRIGLVLFSSFFVSFRFASVPSIEFLQTVHNATIYVRCYNEWVCFHFALSQFFICSVFSVVVTSLFLFKFIFVLVHASIVTLFVFRCSTFCQSFYEELFKKFFVSAWK